MKCDSAIPWGNLSFLEAILILNDRRNPLGFHPFQTAGIMPFCSGNNAKVQV
jgi:hypothetical protein